MKYIVLAYHIHGSLVSRGFAKGDLVKSEWFSEDTFKSLLLGNHIAETTDSEEMDPAVSATKPEPEAVESEEVDPAVSATKPEPEEELKTLK